VTNGDNGDSQRSGPFLSLAQPESSPADTLKTGSGKEQAIGELMVGKVIGPLNQRAIMKRTDVTYGQLDKVLRSLGFSCRVVRDDPPARMYEHGASGASFIIPAFPMTDFVLEHHLIGARTTLDLFGITDPKAFDADLQKAG
jgi:hypothetical protein